MLVLLFLFFKEDDLWRRNRYEGKYVVESNLDGMAYAEFETFREAERFIAKQLDKAERMKKDRRRSK